MVALASIEAIEGTYPYNPLYFAAETADHYRLDSTWLIDGETLDSGDLRAGQKIRGWIGFEIESGQTIEAIHLEGVFGDVVAIWRVQ
ncbi:hypothetical protein ACW9HC_34495 [Nocardia gipuzkoensis]